MKPQTIVTIKLISVISAIFFIGGALALILGTRAKLFYASGLLITTVVFIFINLISEKQVFKIEEK